jgi:hypothetical protein
MLLEQAAGAENTLKLLRGQVEAGNRMTLIGP